MGPHKVTIEPVAGAAKESIFAQNNDHPSPIVRGLGGIQSWTGEPVKMIFFFFRKLGSE